MNERLKKLRKVLDLTQQEFADKIGSKRNTIAKYETEANTPSAAVVSLICREFNVNENWLRYGTGAMFIEISQDEEITTFVGKTLASEDNSFKKRFISMLASLDESDWEVIEKMTLKLHNEKELGI